MDSQEKFRVIGLMSGTSLDGVDLVSCQLKVNNDRWRYTLEAAETIRYSGRWIARLSSLINSSGLELTRADREYGEYLGQLINNFRSRHKLKKVDLVASHGHTVFHQPKSRFTLQIGNGNAIAAVTGLKVAFDFRSLDVALGGQGAPLVPIGDKFLFSEYDCCLNLGGIANISFDKNGVRKAFDVCFTNMPLNYLAQSKGKTYDKGGALAARGEVHAPMLLQLRKFYDKHRHRHPSLGYEMFASDMVPILKMHRLSVEDRMATLVESIAIEITNSIPESSSKWSILCTGGGAFNNFLVYRIMDRLEERADLVIPEPDVVKYKEAIVFALLGVLRSTGRINSLKSVTGASRDNVGGLMTC